MKQKIKEKFILKNFCQFFFYLSEYCHSHFRLYFLPLVIFDLSLKFCIFEFPANQLFSSIIENICVFGWFELEEVFR